MALSDVVDDVRRIAQDQPFQDGISTAPSPASSGTTISFTTATAWRKGDWFDVPAIGEQCLITSGTTNPYTIARSHNETTAGSITTSHIALKRPRYGTAQIEEAIQRVADRMYPDVWEVTSTTLTYSASAYTYALPATFIEPVALVQASLGGITDTTPLTGWSVVRDTASGGWLIRVPSWHRTDVTARLTYLGIPVTTTADTALQRIMAIGAAEELLVGEASQKADRKEEEDRTIRLLRAARLLKDDYDRACTSYRSQLRQKHGTARRFVRAGVTYGGS